MQVAVVVLLAGCSCPTGNHVLPDARVPADASVDGHADAGSDAANCSVEPPPPGPADTSTSVLFDSELRDSVVAMPFPTIVAVFPGPSDVSIITNYELLRVAYDGSLIEVTPHPLPEPLPVAAAQGTDSLGVLFTWYNPATSLNEIHACVLRHGVATTWASCPAIVGSGSYVPRIAWNGATFDIYFVAGSGMRRTELDTAGSFIGTADLYTATTERLGVSDVAMVGSRVYLCVIGRHGLPPSSYSRWIDSFERLDAAGRTEIDLLPQDFGGTGGCQIYPTGTGVTVVENGTCAWTGDEIMLVGGVSSSGTPTALHIPLPFFPSLNLWRGYWNGANLVLGLPTANDLSLFGLDTAGQVTFRSTPLALNGGNSFTLGAHALVPIPTSNEALVFYEITGFAQSIRVARISF